jgi:hypothetical protein
LSKIEDGASYADRATVDQHRKTKTFGAWSSTAAQNAWSCAMNGRRTAIVGWTSFDLDEFLAQEGAAQTALIDELFHRIEVDA